MMLALAVSVAAGLGALARYVIDQLVQRRSGGFFPCGTVLVNLSGSLLLGLVLGGQAHHGLAEQAAMVLGAGFAGGFTTLSTWAWETVVLLERGNVRQAVTNLVVSFVGGLLAAAAGFGVALLGS